MRLSDAIVKERDPELRSRLVETIAEGNPGAKIADLRQLVDLALQAELAATRALAETVELGAPGAKSTILELASIAMASRLERWVAAFSGARMASREQAGPSVEPGQ